MTDGQPSAIYPIVIYSRPYDFSGRLPSAVATMNSNQCSLRFLQSAFQQVVDRKFAGPLAQISQVEFPGASF